MIKKGDKFECIKPVIMDGNPEDVAYTEGELYTSDFDNCITDNQGNKSHYWRDKAELTIYFKKINTLPNKQKEMVNHPSHYKNNKYECIDVMLDIFGKEKVLAFCELNAFKYQWRANFKGTDIQDKKKAEWYLNKYIELKENKDE
jgi:hypothetical protein